MNARRQARKDAGLCTVYGCPSPPRPGKTLCQECADEQRRRSRLYFIRKKGGTDGVEWMGEMLAAQGGTCAICGKECDIHRNLAVDHDHESGKVRGLLCQNCNVGLGHFKDNPALLQQAIDYLRRTA